MIRLGLGSGLGFGADPLCGAPLTDAICTAQATREGEDTKGAVWALRWRVKGSGVRCGRKWLFCKDFHIFR
jgi:hypothetical protein